MAMNWIEPEKVIALAKLSDAASQPCACAKQAFDAWESVPITFPEELLACLGSISPTPGEDLTFLEYHPAGTTYWSPNAPLALNYFPANRCDVWQCRSCSRCYLRYTEFGGYYQDRRIRRLRSSLLVVGDQGK